MSVYLPKRPAFGLFVVLFSLFFYHSNLSAAKMYKWVDENGEVHFSQTPPLNSEQPVSPDKVQVQQMSGAVLAPTLVNDQLYCGELKLPQGSEKRRLSVKTLSEKIKYWNQSLDRSKQSLDRFLAPKKSYRYSSSYSKKNTFNEDLARYQKPVNEYQCAIAWANGKMDEVREGEAAYHQEHTKAKKDLEVATAQMHQICGSEPEKYNQYGKKRERYLEWRRCTRKHSEVVREMRDRLRAVERKIY
ncbi:DUF4124 domain-containing protein [Sedimenticola sp.]|uniref:DUF4124 domain-containing protein n=1 Tax=Sedimenticola sp. TaxID=1940285 RepID=UPI003D0EEF1A